LNIGKFSVKRPVTISMCVLILIMFGIVSFTRMSVDLLPEMEMPVLAVMGSYEGAGPEEVEEKVTKPLESSMAGISGIDSMTSISASGTSIVILVFDYETDLNEASNSVRDKLEQAKFMLPSEVDNLSVMKMDMNSMPIMMIAISGDRNIDDVKKIVDETIQPRMERINGVAAATAMGGSEQQVIITADPYRLSAYGLSVGSISQIVAGENSNHPGGYVSQGSKNILVRTLGQYETIEELASTQVSLPTGGTARLGDIVDIQMGIAKQSSYVTADGKEVIALGIQKESGGNTVDVDEGVRQAIEELQSQLYDDIEIKIAYSSADQILKSVDNVEQNLFLAVVISMLVIFMFLGNIRSTVIIGVAIPISLISTFVLLYFGGHTLNMVTLAALALSVGMVVDNSTVVLENIYRHRSMGKSKYQAAVEGTQEIVSAVVASTLTTVAVYLPFVFISGMTAQLFVPFALTICFALLASLVVSVTVVPMMSSKLLLMHEYNEENKPRGLARFQVWFDRQFNRFLHGYQAVLVQSLNHKKTTLLIVTGALVGSFLLIPIIGAELMPESDSGMINVSIELPNDTVLEETKAVAEQVSELVQQIPELDSVLASVGGNGAVSMGGSSENTATLIVMLTPMNERDRSSKDIAHELQEQVAQIAGADITVESSSMTAMSSSGAISYSIEGDNNEDLELLAASIEEIMNSVDGTVNVTNSLADTTDEIDIVIDRKKAAYYNVSASSVYSTVALSLNDSTISKYRGGDEEVDIVLKYPDRFTQSLDNLQNLMIPSNSGGQVPLTEVASIVRGEGQKSINRQDQSRVATVSCDIYGRDLNSVNQEIEAQIRTLPVPASCTIDTGGDVESMQESFTDLALVIIMALLLVYMVMACQFESLMMPGLIMMSVPVMFIGVFVGLLLTGQTINIMSMMGVLMLEGIVVNNAIVLVDYVQQLRAKGLCKRESVVEAGKTRMRPILMTTLTTALAMIPQLLATGEGSETFKPMAATVIFGLMCSTIISLLVIPILYEVMESWPKKLRRKIMKNNPQEEIDQAMIALEEGCWHDWEELQARLEEAQKKQEAQNS